MFLYIGNSKIIKAGDIIGVFNLKILKKPVNRQFIEYHADSMQKEKDKTFVVTDSNIYFSTVNSSTLRKRVSL